MANLTKEISSQAGKFSPAEIRAKVAESKAFWASPEGKRAAAEQEARKTRSTRSNTTRFPDLAKKVKPTVPSIAEHRRRLLDRTANF